MDQNNHQGWFGEAFVAVLAAAAGLQHAKPYPDLGIDLQVIRSHPDPALEARVELQVKAQRVDDPGNLGGAVTVRLEAHQYRRLTGRRQVPAYLVAVVVPRDRQNFAQASEQALRLNHSAYWVSLEHDPYTLGPEQKTLTVTVPTKNLLTTAVLHDLLDQVTSEGSLL
ncbi:hypothetical protein GCM10009760_09350 [Kitasatospora kazusensis]|uniref:DUF4365 domain-containing protein n=1 Tax=Kitasatospora kazusensis TaxID=407974 RepID=A0ABN2YWC1_9ACTN